MLRRLFKLKVYVSILRGRESLGSGAGKPLIKFDRNEGGLPYIIIESEIKESRMVNAD